jgi:ABC-type polysaccharide/polyol phosphate transport system ATPase subunit
MLPRGEVQATHIWKRFRADRVRRLLRDRIEHLSDRVRGQQRENWRWALRDVSLVAAPGESIGLIGVNGSGKSTLLKILTRVMYPHAGTVKVSGRVGALIEVRAGIHPDLTGRENVYVYGSLIGLSRREVSQRFDDIVNFAELSDAIDRPVKHYSSGMQLRLGFGVSAFMEPDVLLVDEVLAVGDAWFQQRCLDKMRAVLGEGTTLVFVSHDLAAVEAVCSRAMWLDHGVSRAEGPVRDVLAQYRNSVREIAELETPENDVMRLSKVEVAGQNSNSPRSHEGLGITLLVESQTTRSLDLCLGISEGLATPVFLVRRAVFVREGETEIRCLLGHLPLPRGRFCVWLGMFDGKGNDFVAWHPTAYFDVFGPDLDAPPRGVLRLAPVHVDATWEVATR